MRRLSGGAGERISYSLYLIHFPIIWPFYRLAFKVVGESFSHSVLLLVPACAAAIFGAWLLHRFVEGPSQAFSRRVRLVPKPKETVLVRAATEAL